MFTKLLFGCDFSVENLILAKKAKQFADTFGAQLYLVHVVELPVTYSHQWTNLGQVLDEHLRAAKKIMEEFGNILLVPTAHQLVLKGTPWLEINNLVQKAHFDGLLVGNRGIGGLTHLLGSTTRNLTHASSCPVIVLNAQAITEEQKDQEKIFYGRHTSFNQNYPSKGGMKPKSPQSIKEDTIPRKRRVTWGSEKGVSQATSRGPKPTSRMPGVPYGPQDHKKEEYDDDNDKD